MRVYAYTHVIRMRQKYSSMEVYVTVFGRVQEAATHNEDTKQQENDGPNAHTTKNNRLERVCVRSILQVKAIY